MSERGGRSECASQLFRMHLVGIKPVGDEGATGGGFIFQRKENPMTSFF